MPEPATVNLTVQRNGDYAETWIVAESFDEAGEAVNPQDLTGWSATMQVRLYGLAGGSALISLATVETAIQGIRFIEPSAGQMEIRITDATLEALPAAGKAGADLLLSYDLVLSDPTEVESVYAAGVFTVKPGVTR